MKAGIKVHGLVCLVVLALGVSACGSSSTKSTSASASPTQGSQAASAGGAAPKGQAFNLGTICSCSGAQVATLGQENKVLQIWASSVNASGGINGHPVKITAVDDAGNPANALQGAKQLVETDHIQALVSDTSLADASFESYISKMGIPVIGGFSPSISFLTNPDFFATGSTLPVQTVGIGTLAKQAGKKTLGLMYCAESPLCAQLVPLTKAAAQLSGLGFASISISSTAPSYAAPCLAMKSKGVDALFVAANAPFVQRVMASCAQQGYKPLVVSETTTAGATWLKDASFAGAQLASTNPNYTDTSNPGVQEFLAALSKFDPSLQSSSSFSYDTLYPWIAGKLFEAAAKSGKLTPSSTPAQIKAALGTLKGETLGGLAPPLTVNVGHPVFTPCYFGVGISNGAFQDLAGGKPICLTAAQTAQLHTAFKNL